MAFSIQDAVGLCKTILRNGYEAYIITPSRQFEAEDLREVDIATDMSLNELSKVFPQVAKPAGQTLLVGQMLEGGILYRFYPNSLSEAADPEASLVRVTPGLLENLGGDVDSSLARAFTSTPRERNAFDGMETLPNGEIRFKGLPDVALKRNYILGVRVLRFSANYQTSIEANTWMAVVRGAKRIVDYCPVAELMNEWRKVEAENLWAFVKMLKDSTLLHHLIPEVAALDAVRHIKNEVGGDESVLAHTINVMRRYPEELPYDWYGTMACLFHDMGKLYTAEYTGDRWIFNEHHRVGARITRKLLKRLAFEPQDIDLICHLVQNHLRFKYMLNDRGIRRFRALDEYPRLIEMARADIKAREALYTEFNHNMKMLERTETPEEMIEPLLNGNEIMEFTGLKPGPGVGLLREALLKAQIAGEVSSVPEAVEFVIAQHNREVLPGPQGRVLD